MLMKLHIHVTTINSGATEVLTESDGVQAAGTALGLGDLVHEIRQRALLGVQFFLLL